VRVTGSGGVRALWRAEDAYSFSARASRRFPGSGSFILPDKGSVDQYTPERLPCCEGVRARFRQEVHAAFCDGVKVESASQITGFGG
jgi:hypothetical protein